MITPQPSPVNTGYRWEHFDHEADIGIRGFGTTQAEAFIAAALALTAVITDPNMVSSREQIDIELPADDPEWQLYEFLNTIIYEMATRKMLFGEYRVQFVDGRLLASAIGEALDQKKHQPIVEIKGATLTELKVHSDAGIWCAQCVVDV